jgi:hypothetical protein
VLILLGLAISEIGIFLFTLRSPQKSNDYGLFVGWAWGYLLLIWGAAAAIFITLMLEDVVVSYLIPSFLKCSSSFRKLCVLAIDLDDGTIATVARSIVALLANLLLFFILFSPTVLRYLVPPIEMVGTNIAEMLPAIRKSFLYAVFLWFFPGTFGPAMLYAIRYARVRALVKDVRRITSFIQSICYLAILVTLVELASGLSGIGIVDTTSYPFFLNIYAGLVIPSTFASTAIMRFFGRRNLQEAGAIFLFSLVVIFSTVIVFGTLDTHAGGIMIIVSVGLVFLTVMQLLHNYLRSKRKL